GRGRSFAIVEGCGVACFAFQTRHFAFTVHPGICTMKKHKGSGLRHRNRKMIVEQLERRALLAGVVNVSVDAAGNLFVTGDSHDNLVLVTNPAPGVYTVTGFDFADTTVSAGHESGLTFINAKTFVDENTAAVTGVTGNIIIDLKGGNNGLGVGNSVDDLLT